MKLGIDRLPERTLWRSHVLKKAVPGVWLTIDFWSALPPLAQAASRLKFSVPPAPSPTPMRPPMFRNLRMWEPTYSAQKWIWGDPDQHQCGAIKCQQISGGDGFATMGDGSQTYMFSFGPLSGLADIANGKPGTQFPDKFNVQYTGT